MRSLFEAIMSNDSEIVKNTEELTKLDQLAQNISELKQVKFMFMTNYSGIRIAFVPYTRQYYGTFYNKVKKLGFKIKHETFGREDDFLTIDGYNISIELKSNPSHFMILIDSNIKGINKSVFVELLKQKFDKYKL